MSVLKGSQGGEADAAYQVGDRLALKSRAVATVTEVMPAYIELEFGEGVRIKMTHASVLAEIPVLLSRAT